FFFFFFANVFVQPVLLQHYDLAQRNRGTARLHDVCATGLGPASKQIEDAGRSGDTAHARLEERRRDAQ
ncbi:MAG UNVERIFIED_CONTAM: hypothetical protein LVT10_19295, partial [Anaerolineae bacterium]